MEYDGSKSYFFKSKNRWLYKLTRCFTHGWFWNSVEGNYAFHFGLYPSAEEALRAMEQEHPEVIINELSGIDAITAWLQRNK